MVLAFASLTVAACSSGGSSSTGTAGTTGAGGSRGGTTGTAGTTGGGNIAGTTANAGTGGTGVAGSVGTGAAGTMGAAGTGGSTGTAGTGAGGGSTGAAGTGGTAGAGTAGGGGHAGSTAAGGAGGQTSTRPMRVLLYTQGSSGVISGVPAQITIYKQKLTDWGYQVDDSADATMFTDANLAKYAAVGMINTCFYPFGNNNTGTNESKALQKFLQQGGGLFGTHCADVTFTSAATIPLYNQLLGGWAHNGQNSGDNGSLTCTKKADHPTSTMLPATFTRTGNVDVADVTQDATVLVECKYGNTTTPVSWVRTEMGVGRVFYTSFGKTDAELKDATVGDKHIIAGLGWVLGR